MASAWTMAFVFSVALAAEALGAMLEVRWWPADAAPVLPCVVHVWEVANDSAHHATVYYAPMLHPTNVLPTRAAHEVWDVAVRDCPSPAHIRPRLQRLEGHQIPVVWWVPDEVVGVPGPSTEDKRVQTPDWKPRGWWWLVSVLVALDVLLAHLLHLAPLARDLVLWWLGASVVHHWIRERSRRVTAPHRPVSANLSLAIIGRSDSAVPRSSCPAPVASETRATGCCEQHSLDIEDHTPPASPSGSSESWATAGPATPPPTVSCVVSPEDQSMPPPRAPASPARRSESALEECQGSFLCPPFPRPDGPSSPRPPRLPSTSPPGSNATAPLASIPKPFHLPATLAPTSRGRPPRLQPPQRAPAAPIPPSADSTPTTHALDRFVRMRRMGLPVEVVAHALVREAVVHDLASALEFAEQLLSPEHAPEAVVVLPRVGPPPAPRTPVIRRLHWHALSAEEVNRRSAHSVWRRVPSSLPPTVDRAALRADLARLFSSASSVPVSASPGLAPGSTAPVLPATSSCSPTSIAPSQDVASDGTKQYRSATPSTSVPAASLPLDSRALLRCGIAFRRLEREGGALRCVRAVRDGARDRISDAALVIFGSSIPRFTPETHSALQAISTSSEPLASFVLAVAHCPRFFPRADAMLTLASAAEAADGLLTDSNALHRASEWVCQSEALARLLSTVLFIGNLLNGTESSVAAFAVSRMTRLESVRGTSTTFLDYCAQRFREWEPSLASALREERHIVAAMTTAGAALTGASLTSALSSLRESVARAEAELGVTAGDERARVARVEERLLEAAASFRRALAALAESEDADGADLWTALGGLLARL